MINENYLEKVIEVRDMLSGAGGYFHESHAPCLGGAMHGQIKPIAKLHPYADLNWDLGEVTEGHRAVYARREVLLCVHPAIETMKVFVEERYNYILEKFEGVLTDKTIDKLLEAWACDWHEQMQIKLAEG